MSNLQIFKNERFGEIRWIKVNEKDFAVGIDVARALGYKNPNDAIARHCKGYVKHAVPTNSGEQQMNVISEGDIYRLTAKSELPGAERFESWIFDEVLPSIRKHGEYSGVKEFKAQSFESTNKLMADISPLLDEANCTSNQKLIVFKGILRKAGIELPLEFLEPVNGQRESPSTELKSHVSDFLLEECKMQAGRTTIPELYGAYVKWCKERCVEKVSSIKFGKIIRSTGITNGRSNARRYWREIIVKN
ncbi:Bro-N domain-containing protein [Clostridium sp. FP1]|uniref:BRO-N domain-containing protein n=1 Tax=Clostridium sp. FP1 TaxID=2724076 RepID=UPI0013E957C1|nr:BRO family protein [Clostridium sp. FP1]MBZ9633149.1 hypothetical protein [Clostridium sp. FP1]